MRGKAIRVADLLPRILRLQNPRLQSPRLQSPRQSPLRLRALHSRTPRPRYLRQAAQIRLRRAAPSLAINRVRAVIQRVNRANVTSSGEIVGSIGLGLAVLLAVGRDDVPEDGRYIVDKTLNLRIFSDDAGRFARSLLDVNGELLLVSQFTLYGDTRKGRRPSFVKAAPPEIARESFTDVVERFRAAGLKVETGRFQAMMEVELVNAGPVTIIIDSADRSSLRY